MNEAHLLLFESINRGQRFTYNLATILYTFFVNVNASYVYAYLYIYAQLYSCVSILMFMSLLANRVSSGF